MFRKLLISALLLLAFLGIADSTYLAETALTGSQLTCSIKGLDGCNVVAQSVYSHLFGIPLGVYGVGFYSILFILAGLAVLLPKKFVHDALAALCALGLLASIAFVAIQVFLIKALCVYCLGSATIALFACIVSVLLWNHFRTTYAYATIQE